jgi:hypothetical protein
MEFNCMRTKVTMNLPTELVGWAKAHATDLGTTTTEVFKQALKTFRFIKRAETEGQKVLLEAPDGTLRELVWRG